MEPGKVAVRTVELAELRLLAEPEDAERQKAEQPRQEPWRRGRERMEEFGLRVDVGWLGGVKVEHQNGRRDGEKAVAQRRDAADLAAGQSVVVGLHRRDHRLQARSGSIRPIGEAAAWRPFDFEPLHSRIAGPRSSRCRSRSHCAFPTAIIADLRERLARTRFPDSAPGEPWAYGTDVDYLRSLVEYWRGSFDWRAQEARLNAFPQFKLTRPDSDLHFLHVPGKGPIRCRSF